MLDLGVYATSDAGVVAGTTFDIEEIDLVLTAPFTNYNLMDDASSILDIIESESLAQFIGDGSIIITDGSGNVVFPYGGQLLLGEFTGGNPTVGWGDNYQLFRQATGIVTTTATTDTPVISDTTTSLDEGTYKVTFSYSYNSDTTVFDIRAKHSFGGTLLGGDLGNGYSHVEEVKDSGGGGPTGSIQQLGYTRSYFIQITAAGTQTVNLDVSSEKSGKKVSIWGATVEVHKVSESLI